MRANIVPKKRQIPSFVRAIVASLFLSGSFIVQSGFNREVEAATEAYCRFSQAEILTKQRLLQSSLEGNFQAGQKYKSLLQQHSQLLNQCRRQTCVYTCGRVCSVGWGGSTSLCRLSYGSPNIIDHRFMFRLKNDRCRNRCRYRLVWEYTCDNCTT